MTLAVFAAVATLVPSAGAEEPNLRCTRADAVVIQRLRSLLDDSDMRTTLTVYHTMSKITAARIDCRRGRVERGLDAYRQLDSSLASQTLGKAASK